MILLSYTNWTHIVNSALTAAAIIFPENSKCRLRGNSQKITTRRATSFPHSGTRRYAQVRASDKSVVIPASMPE